jgi:hypothetical protein
MHKTIQREDSDLQLNLPDRFEPLGRKMSARSCPRGASSILCSCRQDTSAYDELVLDLSSIEGGAQSRSVGKQDDTSSADWSIN